MARRWWTLAAVCTATFMLLVDVTIVQVALPQIQRDLHASLTDLQWIIDAYALALAALILTGGSLADRFGRQRVFLGGVVLFTAASVLCGLANSATFLIVARAIQGIGGAALFATSLALIGQEFSGAERGTAIAAWGATVGGAVAIGPLVGGVVTSGLGWQWIFFVNAPIGVLAVGITHALIRNIRDPGAARLDAAGLVCFSGALFALVFALQRGNGVGWGSAPILALLAGGIVLLVIFVIVEMHQRRPMFDLELFRKPAFCGVSLATFAIGAGMLAELVFLTLYLQDLLGYSALDGGVRMLPLTSLLFVVPVATRRFVERVPARYMLGGGLGLIALGLFLMHDVSASSRWTALLPGMLLAGAGIGFANPAIASTALGVVAPTRTGMASGINNTFRLAGLATGIAAFGAIFTRRISTDLHASLPHAGARLADAVAAGGVHAAVAFKGRGDPARTLAAARHAFIAGFSEILLVGAVVALVGALGALLLIRARDFERVPAPGPAERSTRQEASV
jgi:EmrB/QacA subfamily drug resistance transporter